VKRWLLAALLLPHAFAQAGAPGRTTVTNAHLWATYDGDHKFGNSRWGAHLEGHWRRHNAGLTWQQLLLRPGITYTVNPLLHLTFGYAFIETWPYGSKMPAPKLSENRLWEQAALKYKTGKVAWLSRFRFENRWLEQPIGPARYENRLRLMQKLSVPTSRKTYFTASDEYWVYIEPYLSASAFDQNRAYAALGWKLADHWKLETGYMHQGILRRTGLVFESNHTLRLTLVSDAAFGSH
jgi:hypothetical protein